MTGPQRKAHLLLWLILGPIALIGLVLALAWRPPVPVQESELPGVQSIRDVDQGNAEGSR